MRNLSPDALLRDSPAIDHLARSRTGEPDVAPATCAGPRDGARLVDVPPMRWRHERHWFTSTAGGPAELNHGSGSGSGTVPAVAPPGPLGPAPRTEPGLGAAVLRAVTLADLNRDLALRQGESPRPARGRAWDAADRLVLRLWAAHTGSEPSGTHVLLSGTDRPARLARLLADGLTAELDTPVDAADLLRHDSLAAVADVARAVLDTREERGPVHVLAPGTAGVAPLLLFHPGGSTCTVYRPLLERLPEALPCVGFERVPGASVEERVDRLLPLVREAQRDGPYRLAGWSFGGALAYGLAARLAGEGADVDLVALIDTTLPLPEPGLDPRASSARRFLRFTGYVEGTYGRAVHLGHDELAPLPEEEQIELTVRRVAEAGLLGPGVLRRQRQSFLDTLAAERAVPPPYDGRVVLYRATEPYAAGLAMEPRYSRTDAAAGWADLCPRLEIVPVAAHHLSVVDPPHVDVIARHLAGLLRQRG